MTEKRDEHESGLTPEELEGEEAEALPDREAMSVITPTGEPTYEIGLPPPRD
jgi:hypothetical protein